MPAMRRKDVLDLDDFSVAELQEVLETAEAMKEVLSRPIKRVPPLRGKTIVNCFYEASTRTRVSFELAGKNLSADVVNITASGSSVEKGESLIDTTRTLQALGADTVVMRHPYAGAPYLVARELEAGVVNAGDGWHAHPTQALLDLFTVRERLGSIEGRRDRHHRGHPAQPGGPLGHLGLHHPGGGGDPVRPAHPDPLRDRGRGGRGAAPQGVRAWTRSTPR